MIKQMKIPLLVVIGFLVFNSVEILAVKEKKCFLSPISKIRQLFRMTTYSAIAVCAGHLLWQHGKAATPLWKNIWRNLSHYRIKGSQSTLIDLLQEGCMIAGMYMLGYWAVISCLNEFIDFIIILKSRNT